MKVVILFQIIAKIQWCLILQIIIIWMPLFIDWIRKKEGILGFTFCILRETSLKDNPQVNLNKGKSVAYVSEYDRACECV